jgi:hypothetical protein
MFVKTCCPAVTDVVDVVPVDVVVEVDADAMAEVVVAAATWVGGVDDAVPDAGVGGASRRMNIAKLVMSDA